MNFNNLFFKKFQSLTRTPNSKTYRIIKLLKRILSKIAAQWLMAKWLQFLHSFYNVIDEVKSYYDNVKQQPELKQELKHTMWQNLFKELLQWVPIISDVLTAIDIIHDLLEIQMIFEED